MRKFNNLQSLPRRVLDGILMQPWVSSFLRPFGNDLPDRNWVFVIGCYNSGTTLLAKLLQAHPKLIGLRNEGAFLTNLLPYPERFGWPRMWAMCSERLQVPIDDDRRARSIRKNWSLWIRGSEKIIVEKSISNTLRIGFLHKNFENAKFVHIVRNGFAVAHGIRKKANLARWNNPLGIKKYSIEQCATQWLESIRVVEEKIDQGYPIITVRYEDVVNDTVGSLRPVFEFIEVEPIEDPSMWGVMQVHGRSSEVRDMNAASIAALTRLEMDAVRRIADSHLEAYRYD